MIASGRILGALLRESGALGETELETALRAQAESGERLGEITVRLGFVKEETVARTLARQLGLVFEPGPLEPAPDAVPLVGGAFARRHGVVPIRCEGRKLVVAMADPLQLSVVDDLQFQSGRRVVTHLATSRMIREGLARAYEGEVSELVRSLPGGGGAAEENGSSPHALGGGTEGLDERAAAESPPVVRLVDLLLRRAVESTASDLHVEQGPDDVVVRERVDGVLRRVTELPPGTRRALLSRIKVLAGMDISEKRRPQDGGFPLRHAGRVLSVRVSTLPVEEGEKAVLRLLDPRSAPSSLDVLGFAPRDLIRLRALIQGGRGVILAAGPTGSGKSSTLFGALAEVDRERMNVVTLEDPIEYRIRGVNQVQVHPRAGLTFPLALRAVLRQDPDVIMVGEIRDRETAEIAMAAAITGHLVLSTIHTIDAPSAITRLLHMGVPAHLVAGGLAGVVAQRLVRTLCPGCGGAPTGCSNCHSGYRGRTGVFQLLSMREELREAIAAGADLSDIRRRAESGGMGSMGDDARRKVAEGVTSPHEVSRVLREDPGSSHPCRHCKTPIPSDAMGCTSCGQPAVRVCMCGRRMREGWRFCPSCLRAAPPPLPAN